ncbi:MAG: AMP-binding protein [Actinomycetota bacterium]
MKAPSQEETGAAQTIPRLFESAVESAPGKEWLFYEDATWTFEQAHERVAAAAHALEQLGAGRSKRVLATARNSSDYLFTWLATVHLGASLVAVNPESRAEELAGLIGQVQPHVVVSDDGLRESIESAIDAQAAGAQFVLAEELATAPGAEVAAGARPDDVAVMIPTSGTTGRSKLVMQTQRAYAMAGEGFPFWLGLDESDRLMTSLPLFHVNAPAYSVLGSVAARAGLILLPRFSGSGFIDSARRYGATEFNAIGAMIEILMRQPERDDDADNPLRLCYTGPSPARDRHLAIERRFELEIVCGYALSESPYGLIWRKGTRPYETLGSARQHPSMGEINQARVIEEEREVGVGEVGELELKNPAVMVGYYGMPDETNKVLSDGWLRTGDLVRVNDDGTFTFVGRRKELIRRRGENLAPLEVETALEAHAYVDEAAVIGVPSELSEEEVKAFVVLTNGASVSPAELRAFAAERLAPFKVPRYVEVVDDLPHTPTGRIAKHELPSERNDRESDFEPARANGEKP